MNAKLSYNLRKSLVLIFIAIPLVKLISGRFEHLTVENGLAHTDAVAIVQDFSGLVWIGTNSGLQSYDGYNINHYDYYKNSNSRVRKFHNRITALSHDNENLWLGTKSGLLCFSLNHHTFTEYKSKKSSSVINGDIKMVYTDVIRNVWIKVGGKLFKTSFDNETRELSTIDSIPSTYPVNGGFEIHSIISTKKFLWLFTAESILQVKSDKNKINIINRIPINQFLPFGQTLVSVTNYKDYIYLRTEQGCVRLRLNSKDGSIIQTSLKYIQFNKYIKNLPLTTTGKMVVDKNGTLWVITQNGLLEMKNPFINPTGNLHSKVFSEPKSLSTNFLSSLFIDRDNNLWIGTWGGGVNYLLNKESFFKLIKYTPESQYTLYDQFVKGIETDNDGTLWILTQKGGLNHYDKNKGLINNYSFSELPITNRVFKDLAFTPDRKSLLIGSMDGLILFQKSTKKSSILIGQNGGTLLNKNIHIYSFDTDNFGNIWVGTWDAGLFCLRNDNNKFRIVEVFKSTGTRKILSNLISFIYCDKDKNEVFVCTDNGLNRLIQNKNGIISKILTYTSNEQKENTISNDFISVIDKQNDSIYWAGTLGGGLLKLQFKGYTNDYNAKVYLKKDGILSDNVEIVLVDKIGNVWFSGNGISKLDTKSNIISYYDYRDGLQGNSFKIGAGHKDESGTLYFGGIYGMNYFNPVNITSTDLKDNLILSNLYIHSKLIEPGDENEGHVVLVEALNETKVLKLRHYENDFGISFSALNYWTTSQIKYRYRLRGLSNDWQYVNGEENKVYFSNLDYDTYTFEIQVSSNGGKNWSGSSKALNIKILPPWWLSFLAKLFYFLILIFVVITIFRFYNREMKMKHKLELKELEETKMEENHQLKLQFFMNISHEFKTPLTLILSSIERMNLVLDADNMRRDFLETISRNAHKMLMLINELMDFRKTDIKKDVIHLTHGNITESVEQIKHEFDTWAEKKQIQIKLKTESINLYFDKEKFAKILSNLLSNSLKYSDEGKVIELEVKRGFVQELRLKYEDNHVESYNELKDECCLIFVRDEGVGISKDSISQIFDRFFQVESKTSMHLGSGIGLAVAKNMVLSHKGTIIVDSQRNVGTEFIVAIPLNLKPENSFAPNESSFDLTQYLEDQHLDYNYDLSLIEVDENSTNTSDKPVLLVVEDNLELLHNLKQYFSDDYQVLIAENGKIGLELCKTEYPDLIVSDVMMPEMDGIQLCSEIRENLNISYTPIILLTAKSDVEHQLEGYEAGADLYIPKPFSLKLLELNIKRLIMHKAEIMRIVNDESGETPTDFTLRNDIIDKKEKEFIAKLIVLINENLDDTDYSVEKLCRELGVGRTKLYTKVKDNTGQALGDLIRDIRLNKAAHLLRTTDMNITEVIYDVGFGSNSHFSKAFKARFGMTPTEYAKSKN